MTIIVQKFGGSSVADIERIAKVAERVAATVSSGAKVVAVVSAMGGTTDELLALARQICPSPSRRELDMLLTAGERISMALLSMALNARDVPAVSFTGSQSGIITTDNHTDARIIEVRPWRVLEELERGRVVIVAGYQGVSLGREVTTLGRGGSDTTAVALAAALEAKACEIYSDVEGVFTADPRIVPEATRLESISYEAMQELARAGAQVLNAQAVEFAKAKGIRIHARSTFGGARETRIESVAGRDLEFAGVASQRSLSLLRIGHGSEGAIDRLLEELDSRGLEPLQHFLDREGSASLLFRADTSGALSALLEERGRGEGQLTLLEGVGTVSVIGAEIGERLSSLRAFRGALLERGIAPLHLSTASARIAAILEGRHLDEAARGLHAVFGERGALPGAGSTEA